MRLIVYKFLWIAFGVIISIFAHAGIEFFIIDLLTKDFHKYGLGFSWDDWFLIHRIGSVILLVLGILFGLYFGNYFKDYAYVKGFWKKRKKP